MARSNRDRVSPGGGRRWKCTWIRRRPPWQRDRKGKRRPQGRTATPPAEVAARTGQILTEREAEWLDRSARDPASFAAGGEVHDQARHQADLYVAGLLAKASERPEMAEHIAGVTAAAEVPLRPVEKKQRL